MFSFMRYVNYATLFYLFDIIFDALKMNNEHGIILNIP